MMFRKDVVSKALHKRLPSAGRLTVHWHGFWFRWLLSDIKRKNVRRSTFFLNMRLANARDITIGPIGITIPCRWLDGPARQLHPEIYFSEKDKEQQKGGVV